MTPTFVAPEVDWFHLTPLMLVLLTGVLGVLLEAFVPARARRVTQLTLSLLALGAALVVIVVQWDHIDAVEVGGLQILGGSYLLTQTTLFIQGLIVVLSILAVLTIADRTGGAEAFAPAVGAVPGSDYEELARRKNMVQTEIYPLFLFAVGGMMIFPAAGDLLTMFIGLEILSLPLYVMTGMARHRRLLSQEASIKYFLLGAFASALFLFGMALVYGYTASLRFTAIYAAVRSNGAGDFEGMGVILVAGLILMIAGALFKVGAVPFHQWTPDVYQGAPTPITGFMAACTKAAAFGAIMRLMYWSIVFMAPNYQDSFITAMWVIAIATMLVGSVGAIVQVNIKRLLAYSSIAHAGFIIVGLISFNDRGMAATLFYLAAYGVATIGAFAIVQLVRETSTTGSGDEVILGEATHLSQWAGLGKRNPWIAGAFALFLLSFAGVPLTGGFIGKFQAFTAAVGVGSWVLAVVAALCSAIAVFFYIRIIVLMYFVDPQPRVALDVTHDDGSAALSQTSSVVVENDSASGTEAGVGLKLAHAPTRTTTGVTVLSGRLGIQIVIFACALGTILLGVLPGPVLELVAQAAKFLP